MILLVAMLPLQEPPLRFAEVAKASGIDCVNQCGDLGKPRLIDTIGSGLCWFDYDGDGWLDLFIPNGSTFDAYIGTAQNTVSDRLYRNQGDGSFADVTEKAGLKDDRWSMSAAAADFDADGDEDLYVCNFGLNFLYRNNGDGTFTDIAVAAGVEFDGPTFGAAWGDIDGDGDLDLYVSAYMEFDPKHPWPPYGKKVRDMRVLLGPKQHKGMPDKLFRNNGDATFADVTKESGLRVAELDHGFTIQMVDLDRDDLIDLFVANDMSSNHHYRQAKTPGKFIPCGAESGLAVDHDGKTQACMGVAIADLNGDQIPDFAVTNFSGEKNALYLSRGDNQWLEDPELLESAGSALTYVGWGVGFFDFDLDGDEDLAVFNGHIFPDAEAGGIRKGGYDQPPILYRRDADVGGSPHFTEVTRGAGPDFDVARPCRGAAFADYDEDGDADIALFQMDRPALLLRNETDRKGHFARVELLGTTANRDGYGARVTLVAGGARQTRWKLGQGSFISESDPRPLFGLGANTTIDRIVVRWPGGAEDVVEGPLAADRTLVIRQGHGKVGELAAGQVWTRAQSAALFDAEHAAGGK